MEGKTKKKRKRVSPKRSTTPLRRITTDLATLITVMHWTRFSYELTPKVSRTWLKERLRIHASASLSGPCSDADVVAAIAKNVHPPIRVHHLSQELERKVTSRGRTVFGYAWNEIDKIACDYEHMYWWISEAGLSMDTIVPPPLPEEFDQIAGRLIFTMRQEFPDRRCVPKEKYLEIAARLDELGRFTPRDVLSEEFDKKLAEWNQKNGKAAILTFSRGLSAQNPRWIHFRIMKRFHWAEEKFKRRLILT